MKWLYERRLGRQLARVGVRSVVRGIGISIGIVALATTAIAQDTGTQGIPREIQPDDVTQAAPSDTALARAPRGLTITVVDFRGPVPGAKIKLVNGKKTVTGTTGPTGVALLDVRKQGAWQVEVSAENYLPSEGVIPWPARTAVELELRSLEEGTPAFAEGTTEGEIRQWLERGQSLLDAGKHAEARTELAKALRHLRPGDQAEVRTSMARALWLEGKREESLEQLEEAIRLAPEAENARVVYTALMDGVGRGDEVNERIQALSKEAPTIGVDGRPNRNIPKPDPSPVSAHQVGVLEATFEARHPEADMKEVLERLDYPSELRAEQTAIDLADESFDVVVPESYAQRTAEDRWGVFVWISPVDRGGVRGEAVRAMLEQRKLIWIGANDSGNRRSYWQRVALALHAATNAQKLWDIAEDRVFVGGYSGGGRTSSMVAWLWPETFNGAVFWMGTDFYEAVPVPFAPGKSWAPRFPKPKRSQLRLIKDRSKFAYVTGDFDFNRSETKAIFRRGEALGFENNTYIQIPEADHYQGMSAENLERALAAIEP